MLFVLSVQHNLTFNTRPPGNSRQFYPRSRYSREHCTRFRDYRGFYILFNPVPAGNRGLVPTPVQNSSKQLYSALFAYALVCVAVCTLYVLWYDNHNNDNDM